MIKGIFFDAAGVLYRRSESTRTFALKLLQQNGFTADLSAENLVLEKSLRAQANEGKLNHAAYWDQFVLMRGVVNPEQRKTLIAQILEFSNDVLPVPGGRDALAGLKRRGFVLGIVTDTMYPLEWKMRRLEKVGVAEFIDVVTCSTVFGAHKPDPAMYWNALEQARLTPSESAFVGHDAGELEGARQAGMMTVAVNYDPGSKADYYAESLTDLLNVPIFQNSNPGTVTEIISEIHAIFFDVGDTLRIVVADEPFAAHARQQLAALIETPEPIEALFERLDQRWKAYRKWSSENLTEVPEKELWTRFLLPDLPTEKIAPLSGTLTRLWRDKDGRRVPRPDAKHTILELRKRGYCLGIIANTITETEIPDWLAADGLADYFKAVVLSSQVGYRKPSPEIFWEATRRIGIAPAHCAYVGDSPVRDVEGARQAGFPVAIMLLEPGKVEKEPLTDGNKPDATIHALSELLHIFPPRKELA
ncbi:MAG: HAD family hydrolase [Chloroflexi bacterium]|nr:HAD family hydrolase [Chloroflexota bacterium]